MFMLEAFKEVQMSEEAKGGSGFNFNNVSVAGVNVKDRCQELWNGDIPLGQTFWLYYFVAVFVLKIIGGVGGPVGVIFGLLALGWAGFMVKPIFASADKYTGEKHWALAAKAAAVIIAIGVFLNLFA